MVDCVEKHTAYIFDRGGQRKIDELVDLSSVRWERGRDEMSEATVVIQGDACSRQADLISKLRTHRHELVIYRGKERVWEGPLHRIGSHRNYVEIVAKDVLAYLFATPLTRAWDNRFDSISGVTEVTTRFEEIINYELSTGRTMRMIGGGTMLVPAWESLDPPINVLPFLDVRHFPNEARTSAYTLPYEMTVGEHLTSAARTSGIDYTTVGRKIVIWDVSRALGRLPQLTEADFFDEIVVSEYGSDHAQAAYVVGQEGAYGEALQPDLLDYYGPWTQIYTAYSEDTANAPTQGELNSQASRNLSGRVPAPLEVRVPDNSGIILSDDIRMNKLVCGVQIPLRATLNARPIAQLQKLDHLTVIEDAEGEKVQVVLTPATRPDSDEEE